MKRAGVALRRLPKVKTQAEAAGAGSKFEPSSTRGAWPAAAASGGRTASTEGGRRVVWKVKGRPGLEMACPSSVTATALGSSDRVDGDMQATALELSKVALVSPTPSKAQASAAVGAKLSPVITSREACRGQGEGQG